ncbi:hypothetical protein IV203_013149 [Nitzschia inconspicua]|uniref:Uncharacterized protein n=1 Tax=Nitzschia inconspicua TaxID=303405 RepID=A0A9K3Q9Z2_9STRA|nr:hypothetical protein IV203_013149 [Nitzschia inconspicua]
MRNDESGGFFWFCRPLTIEVSTIGCNDPNCHTGFLDRSTAICGKQRYKQLPRIVRKGSCQVDKGVGSSTKVCPLVPKLQQGQTQTQVEGAHQEKGAKKSCIDLKLSSQAADCRVGCQIGYEMIFGRIAIMIDASRVGINR